MLLATIVIFRIESLSASSWTSRTHWLKASILCVLPIQYFYTISTDHSFTIGITAQLGVMYDLITYRANQLLVDIASRHRSCKFSALHTVGQEIIVHLFNRLPFHSPIRVGLKLSQLLFRQLGQLLRLLLMGNIRPLG